MDDLYMMGDDPSAYLTPADDISAFAPPPASHLLDDDDDDDYSSEEDTRHWQRRINTSSRIATTNSTNQMLDGVNNNNNKKNQRKGNRRQNNNSNSNRNRNSNTQRDSTSSFDENNPINVISAFNRTGKIYNKLRKNDAVKVIDTPSGRAGFVYQSGSTASGGSSNNHQMSPSIKENSPNWEDSFSQSSQFVNRNANDVKLIPTDESNASNKKILPVLTADGKIALVVRGDTSRQIFDESQNNGSGNSVNTKKYEPITNLTSIITALNSNTDNNNNNRKLNDSIKLTAETNSELKAIQEQNRLINRLDEFFASVTNKIKHVEEEIEHKLGMDVEEADDEDTLEGLNEMTTSTTTTVEPFIFDNEDENRRDSLLINRPLSEVLGLPKKTHYHHPHDPFNPSADITKLHPESSNGRRINTVHRTSTIFETLPTTTSTDSSQAEEFDLESPEKINIAVIPRFDSELEERLFGQKNNRDMSNEIPDKSGAISSIHCAMQLMVAIACACTVLGVLMSYYRIPLANQFRGIYW